MWKSLWVSRNTVDRLVLGTNKHLERTAVQSLMEEDTLWIRFGDSSEEANDCRGVASTMFCSPRTFWNDVILDRRTQKCRALR
jgi:hypothetical protein